MPVWSSPSQGVLSAIPVANVYGPGFGCIVTAFALTCLGMFIQVFSLIDFVGDKGVDIPNVPSGKSAAELTQI